MPQIMIRLKQVNFKVQLHDLKNCLVQLWLLGVIDLWGCTGGIREDRAALLASNGFATLTVAYCEYRDLPDKYDVLHLSYFERAVDWLIAHPKVMSGGVGLIGLSMGGVLALAIASQIPNKIKAVVSISGPHILIGCSLKCSTLTIKGFPVEVTSANYARYLCFVSIFKAIKETFKPVSPWIIPVEHISCPVLLVYGHDDKLNPEIEWMFEDVFQRMEKHGKGSLCRRLGFPGTGHFITPCYLPPCSRQYVKIYDEVWFLGGNTKDQAKSSEIYWNESMEFPLKETA